MNKYEKLFVSRSETIDALAKKICGYGYYDFDGVPIEKITKYLTMGAQWMKEHGM